MYEFRALLDRFWVTRAEDRELYFGLKRALPDYRRLVNELLGWNLVVNESVVKLEKVPPRAIPWMGIQSFQEPLDYCLLCAVLLFLADLDDGIPFLLSSLTQAVETFLSKVQPVDWTRFPHRKSLVRVLQYAQEVGLVLVYDGNSALFGNDQNQEVLYENTGLSRHFPVHFGRDIMECRSIEDFEAFSWEGDETEQRRRRVYRQLVLAPGLYCSDQTQKEMVNKQIFGFEDIRQYDQLVQLLIMVRAPKLSKDFRPTEVKKLLNLSLQVLTDDDLSAMVSTMEQMDNLEDTLHGYQRAMQDARIIRNEYSRYNQYILGRKGQAYLDARSAVQRLRNQLRDAENLRGDLERQLEEQSERKRQFGTRLEQAKAQRAAMGDDDLSAKGAQLKQVLENCTRLAAQLEQGENRLQKLEDGISRREVNLRTLTREYDDTRTAGCPDPGT